MAYKQTYRKQYHIISKEDRTKTSTKSTPIDVEVFVDRCTPIGHLKTTR